MFSLPLSEIVRPNNLDEMVGQKHIVDEQGLIRSFIESNYLPSIILWGPPGCGKTTLARILIEHSQIECKSISAVTSGVADLKKIFNNIDKKLILFIDEIHRFNKSQQDILLPYIESGSVILIGATTENPSFEINSALLSRCKTICLNRLSEDDLLNLIQLTELKIGKKLPFDDDLKMFLCDLADGDGRYLVNLCENIFSSNINDSCTKEDLINLAQKKIPIYDKKSDFHYNLISALHKSMRGSDVQASLYWLSRMLESGEDPKFILRRLIRFASEDIGLADPQALVQANVAKEAFNFIGLPEGELAIAQAVVYLANAPKSNSLYMSFKAARLDAKKYGSISPPKNILNAPTKLMKDLGYGKNYKYDHDYGGFSGQNFFPEELGYREYYKPKEIGFEREMSKRMNYWNKLRDKK